MGFGKPVMWQKNSCDFPTITRDDVMCALFTPSTCSDQVTCAEMGGTEEVVE